MSSKRQRRARPPARLQQDDLTPATTVAASNVQRSPAQTNVTTPLWQSAVTAGGFVWTPPLLQLHCLWACRRVAVESGCVQVDEGRTYVWCEQPATLGGGIEKPSSGPLLNLGQPLHNQLSSLGKPLDSGLSVAGL
uniref:Uncharacterized protein n=1 Tax=Chlamydomonas euryale TaxID=1486919 RepID=A0A7R9VWV9_9CHLO|mmetsp:Transcript_5118/g.15554  ORF Transcript_5118/g.15554 Transcript_5118/m.15554 type:complete len:136 (+) Transcript_5118:229-636(+)